MGLFTAIQQAALGKRVVLLEAGQERGHNKQLLLGPSPARSSHRGSKEAWTTGLGGTSQLWGGQLWPWQDWEFSGLSERDISAWPLTYREIKPYYDRVLETLGLPRTHALIHGGLGPAHALPSIMSDDYSLRYSSWIDRPKRNFGKSAVVQSRLRKVSIRRGVIVHRISRIGSSDSEVEFDTEAGIRSTLSAKIVILAAGTFGNSRVLRNSELSQDLPALGLGFLDHVSKRIAEFEVSDWAKFRAFSSPKRVRGVLASPRIVPSLQLIKESQALPYYAHWEFAAPKNGAVSTARSWLKSSQTGEERPRISQVVSHFRRESRELAEAGIRGMRYGERPVPRTSHPFLRIDVQQPTRHDVRLDWMESETASEYPSLSLVWRSGREEEVTAVKAAEGLVTLLESLDIGASVRKPQLGDAFEDTFHMMGGTRMSTRSQDGVVDSDCKVFGTQNIFVTGASVFPSGGMANPTFTALALAARIGDFIDG